MAKAFERLLLTLYSLLLTLALAASAPWWGWRMARGGRYREGLAERLGRVPAEVRAVFAGRDVVWVHAVSVGEVLAVERLIAELKQALPGWVVAVSTTTATGQKIARERLAGAPVFYFPLDFAWAVRAWLRALRPKLMVLVESEFWPRHLHECERAGVPVAVVNARVSDRSFPRYLRLRWLWRRLFAKVSLFLAQGDETAARLRAIGAAADKVVVSGNLKWDYANYARGGGNPLVASFACWMGPTRLVVAGSTHESEESALLASWPEVLREAPDVALMIAPRHPQRFDEIWELVRRAGYQHIRASVFLKYDEPIFGGAVILLDTVGDLAAAYEIASVAFVGGSLVQRGGQNPLEPARFGVPVVMGPSYENFREIVARMIADGSLKITDEGGLAGALVEALSKSPVGRRLFEGQTGATKRTSAELLRVLR